MYVRTCLTISDHRLWLSAASHADNIFSNKRQQKIGRQEEAKHTQVLGATENNDRLKNITMLITVMRDINSEVVRENCYPNAKSVGLEHEDAEEKVGLASKSGEI